MVNTLILKKKKILCGFRIIIPFIKCVENYISRIILSEFFGISVVKKIRIIKNKKP